MVTVSFQQGVNGYAGTIDAMLRESRPAQNYATTTNVNIDSADTAGQRNEGLLYFAGLFGSGPGQIPLGATITSATLTLQVTEGSSQGGSLHRMLTNWTGLPTWTWDSFGNGIQFDGAEAVAAADLTTGAVRIGATNLDVTQSLQAWSAGATNYGWAFNPAGPDGWDFNSSEGTVAPKLTVTYELPTSPPPPRPVATIQNASATEGPSTQIKFTLALDKAATQDVVVHYSTLDGTATAATDFVGLTDGAITFTAGQTTATITVDLKDDTVAESTETFTLKLTSASNATIGTSTATGTILDNDSTAPPSLNPKVVNIHDTTAYKAGDPSGAGCGDPSGLAYVPGLNTLFIADSEHDESPYFSPTNLFAVRPDGTFKGSYSLTSFCKEPTGLAYNSKNGFLYITDDDARKVFWVDPKNPTVKLGGFSVKALGMTDPEDPKFDPITGNMYMLDGFSRTFFELTATGQLVRKFVLPSVMTDAEALAYDSSLDVFFVASGATRGTIFEMDHDGNVLATINLLNDPAYRNANGDAKPKIKGLELAPSSNPNDGDHLSLYAADYGQDQQPDGRLFEIDLGAGWLMA
jgi:hypothetical protein